MKKGQLISNFKEFSKTADYSLMSKLIPDPQATPDGHDEQPREVFSGHYVPVIPTALPSFEYISHGREFFKELGLSDELAEDESFQKMFSGDLSQVDPPLKKMGWATGYALSIYGTEYISQCPFGTGNGYGDGRAVSVFEGTLNGKRWEMQLKGGGRTPYCRGGDGRAVLRSSVREFLAQEYMHALGIPSSRSLTLFVSKSETVQRPWYSEGSISPDPDVMVKNPVAISTRVAPSFLRVGQLELFARRTRSSAHPNAKAELEMIVRHLIEREYSQEIDQSLSFEKQILELAKAFRSRLTRLIAHWIRVGYCQGNFNSDNCAGGGFTLDYGPFGFCEAFDPEFQPWTGGGRHFSFLNQPNAAQANFHMFWTALRPLLEGQQELEELDQIRQDFGHVMQTEWEAMWASKMGLAQFEETLFQNLIYLMTQSEADFTIFFRELSFIPDDLSSIEKSFYVKISDDLKQKWNEWLTRWRQQILTQNPSGLAEISHQMKQINPKYTWREWLIVPAYQKAMNGDYSLIKELQEVFASPYEEQSAEIENKYYQLRPKAFFNAGGVSHYSCSS